MSAGEGGSESASASSAACSSGGSSLPRAAARLRIPVAARADSAYRWLGFATSTSDNEHSTAALGNSEETSVENPPRQAIPEVGQRCENDSHVSAVGRGEEPRDVLNEQPAWSKLICDPSELEEEAGSFAGEPCASSGDGDVLTREPAREEINRFGGPRFVSLLSGCFP